MGRYLRSGIATSIQVSGKRGYNVIENKDKLLKQINNYIDVSKYEINFGDNSFVIFLKKEFIENNIHDFVKEINPIIDCDIVLEEFEVKTIEDFTKEKYPIKIKDEEPYYIHGYLKERPIYIFYFSRFFLEDFYDKDNTEINVNIIHIWSDWNKYVGESEIPMLRLLNRFKRDYFINELGKVLFFWVD